MAKECHVSCNLQCKKSNGSFHLTLPQSAKIATNSYKLSSTKRQWNVFSVCLNATQKHSIPSFIYQQI
jgi:hypothetical protein